MSLMCTAQDLHGDELSTVTLCALEVARHARAGSASSTPGHERARFGLVLRP